MDTCGRPTRIFNPTPINTPLDLLTFLEVRLLSGYPWRGSQLWVSKEKRTLNAETWFVQRFNRECWTLNAHMMCHTLLRVAQLTPLSPLLHSGIGREPGREMWERNGFLRYRSCSYDDDVTFSFTYLWFTARYKPVKAPPESVPPISECGGGTGCRTGRDIH